MGGSSCTHIKTKRLIETAEMEYAELMYEMYAEPETSYGDITRYFTENEIQVYGKTLKRGFLAQLLRNPVYVQADIDIYEHFKAQGAKIESPRNCSQAIIAVTYTRAGRGRKIFLLSLPTRAVFPRRSG